MPGLKNHVKAALGYSAQQDPAHCQESVVTAPGCGKDYLWRGPGSLFVDSDLVNANNFL